MTLNIDPLTLSASLIVIGYIYKIDKKVIQLAQKIKDCVYCKKSGIVDEEEKK